MRFQQTQLAGAFLVDLEPHTDERGFFARTYCADEFADHGLAMRVAQCNLSYNRQRGTLRGLHYQVPPHAEAKLIRCIRGSMHAVIVDMRPGSPTYLRHLAFQLSGENRRNLYVPELCAVGMQTLEDDTEVAYQVSEFHAPTTERGLRYDDPALAIEWPLPVTVISDKDAGWPLLSADRGSASP